MAGCWAQILLTPVGQQFLHVLKEELIRDFCRTPLLLDTLGDAISALLEAGWKFALKKIFAEDPTPKEDLKQLVMEAPNLGEILQVDESISQESPWWMDTFWRAFEVFTQGSFFDPTFPAWGVLDFSLAPCPGEMLPFDEIDKNPVENDPELSSKHTPDR